MESQIRLLHETKQKIMKNELKGRPMSDKSEKFENNNEY